jgi:hypothetical protein
LIGAVGAWDSSERLSPDVGITLVAMSLAPASMRPKAACIGAIVLTMSDVMPRNLVLRAQI